ncbi:hypothetical protein NQ318_007974 [Aromia moschata]|uniref:Uncharacterized protein n=1 Tax=Aromia moschata TaxID=1265417 RepID=A0AAV8YCC9_9CUCU|nr:hypothetical protein NQ318_007974 [Aromia moschata]
MAIIAVFVTVAVASAAPSGHLLDAHIVNPHALSPIGPSGIVTGHGASGPSGVVTGAGAVGPSGIVTGHGPVGPTGPAGHGTLLAAPALALAAHGLPLAAPALAHGNLGLAAPSLAYGHLGLAGHGLALGHGLGLAHGVHGQSNTELPFWILEAWEGGLQKIAALRPHWAPCASSLEVQPT